MSTLLSAGVLITLPAVHARSNGLADWRAAYPTSNADDAGCQLCHGSSTNQLNAYGRDLCLLF